MTSPSRAIFGTAISPVFMAFWRHPPVRRAINDTHGTRYTPPPPRAIPRKSANQALRAPRGNTGALIAYEVIQLSRDQQRRPSVPLPPTYAAPDLSPLCGDFFRRLTGIPAPATTHPPPALPTFQLAKRVALSYDWELSSLPHRISPCRRAKTPRSASPRWRISAR